MESTAQMRDLNPVSLENLLDPIPLYRELRNNHPVHWSAPIHGWIISRYSDVMACLRDSRLSNDRLKFYEAQLGPQGTAIIRDLLEMFSRQMQVKDGPDHLRLRRLSSPGFAPRSLDAWRPAIRRSMEMLVNRALPLGRADLVKAVSYELPPLVIAEAFSIPQEERELLRGWTDPLVQFSSPGPEMDMAQVARQANQAIVDFREYMTKFIERRRDQPGLGEDMLTQMLHSQEKGMMTPEEVVAQANLILTAGHATTSDQLSNGIYELLMHPDQLQKLREDRSLLKSAVEEILRYRPALSFIMRVAKEDFQLHGQSISRGSIVYLAAACANRDPEAYPDPDRFDISRDPHHQKHMSFAFGPHHCLGAGLARSELEIGLDVLLERLPALRLDEQTPPNFKLNTMLFRGFNSLHVQW
jgi:cytochrome P450 PksS